MTDFRWHATQLRALPGNLIMVPNAKLSQAIVTNFDRPAPDLGMGVEVTVDTGANLADVERIAVGIALGVMREVPGGMPEVEPSVRFTTFTDLGVRCAVNVRAKTFVDQFLVRHELIKRLHAAFSDAGIGIATLGKSEVRSQK